MHSNDYFSNKVHYALSKRYGRTKEDMFSDSIVAGLEDSEMDSGGEEDFIRTPETVYRNISRGVEEVGNVIRDAIFRSNNSFEVGSKSIHNIAIDPVEDCRIILKVGLKVSNESTAVKLKSFFKGFSIRKEFARYVSYKIRNPKFSDDAELRITITVPSNYMEEQVGKDATWKVKGKKLESIGRDLLKNLP